LTRTARRRLRPAASPPSRLRASSRNLPAGAAKPSIGRLSAQEPQIIRLLPKPRSLAEGESLELHCLYNASGVDRPTRIGLDERSKEMCNQYYLSTSALRVECDGEVAAPSPPANAALNAAVAKYREASEGSPLGQAQRPLFPPLPPPFPTPPSALPTPPPAASAR